MRIGNPYYFGLLWIVPALVVLYVWGFHRKRELIERFVSAELRPRLLANVSFRRQAVKNGLIILATFLALLSLVRPKWGFHWEEVERRGIDILIALDVSKSMLSEDVSPNRLERAKRKIADFLKIVQGDRVGLIAFAGTPFLQCPLTLDHGAALLFLDSVDTDLIPVPGTAIAEAIQLSIKTFEKTDRNSKALILITDGEDTVSNPLDAAKKASEAGMKIYTIGVGKDGSGAPIPEGGGGGFKKDRKGDLVLAKLDEDILQKIALETGGSYVRAITGDMDLEKIYEDLKKKTEDKELKSGRQKRFEERFQWPLFLAWLLLAFEMFLSDRMSPRRTATAALFFFLVSNGAWASNLSQAESSYKKGEHDKALKGYLDALVESPQDPNLKYNAANSYYRMNQFTEAEKLFQAAATQGNPNLSQKAYYNLGNTAYRQGKLEEALNHYKKAMELDPKDADAKANHEFVQKEIKRRLENQKQRQQSGQNRPQQGKPSDKKDSGQQQAKEDPSKSDGKKDGKPEETQAALHGDEKKEKEKEQAGGAAAKQNDKKMSQKEAEQWLSTLNEDRSKAQPKQAQGTRQYQVEKDW